MVNWFMKQNMVSEDMFLICECHWVFHNKSQVLTNKLCPVAENVPYLQLNQQHQWIHLFWWDEEENMQWDEQNFCSWRQAFCKMKQENDLTKEQVNFITFWAAARKKSLPIFSLHFLVRYCIYLYELCSTWI